MKRSVVPSPGQQGQQQVLLSQQRSMEQRSSTSVTTVREAHSRGQETKVSQQTFSSQQHSTNTTNRVQGAMLQQSQQQQQMMISGRSLMDGSPPVFEQIFRNARFAQGGNAFFEGKVSGNPQPELSWTREGQPLSASQKYQMEYEKSTGKVSLMISSIGPGDEGEYTCTAVNKFGEAICTVYIQPEGLQAPRLDVQSVEQQLQQHSSTASYARSQTERSEETTMYSNGSSHEVDGFFKVDTFEYRLLREVEFREQVTRRSQAETETETETETDYEQNTLGLIPPQLVQPPRNTKLLEGSDATFQAKLQGNPKPKLTWFKNGVRIRPGPRHQFSHSNHVAALKIRMILPEDSANYTLFAENAAGCIVSTAFLAVEPVGVNDDLQFKSSHSSSNGVNRRPRPTVQEPSAKVARTTSQEPPAEEPSAKVLAPSFVRVPTDTEVSEGKMVRFDCRVTGRPYPDVAWYLNGQQIHDDYTHKILVNESGNHALMITSAQLTDSGVIQCLARNKGGETGFQCRLSVIEKEQVVAPKFVERFTTIHVKQGEPVSLHARAVGTPIPKLTWQKDNALVTPGPDVYIQNEGGYSALEIPCARLSDAAWYQCTAQNAAGSTATRARLFVDQPKLQQSEPQGLRFPKPTKVIRPEPEPAPEVIYLRHVERARPQINRPEDEERVYETPVFVLPLKDLTLTEGQRAYFEAKANPVSDPTLRVEWFIDGKPLAASSRVTVTYRFGYISLLLIGVIREDSGVYTCRVSNEAGYADSSATMLVGPRATIESTSQHPESLEQIQMLEDYSRYQRNVSMEESVNQLPVFVKSLRDLGHMNEGAYAHFEAQINPVSDPYMRIEWTKDGRSITASSRISTIYNFGYVALNIMHLRAEDAGAYTVKAINRMGEAVSRGSVEVVSRGTVTGDLGIPEQQRYIERIEELEAYQLQLSQRGQPEPIEATSPPEFKSPIKDQLDVREGGFAHFEARLEPIGDPKLTVHWFKDGKPLEASSRSTNFFNFGYVALTIKYITIHDRGVYTCLARNALGEVTTSAQLTVITKNDIMLDSQHPEGLEKIRYLEDDSRYTRNVKEETSISIKPKFLGPMKGTNKIVEGQKAHFEIRLEPQNDPNLIVEWYFNGVVIMQASRIHLFHDFGYVALDILDVRSEDAGTYTVVARNMLGEAMSETTMEVETRGAIDTTTMHRAAYDKAQRLEESKFVEPQYDIEEISKSRPIFVIPLSDPRPVSEGKNVHLECRLEPMGDPTMRVEWFFNGKPITVGSRFKSYFDFGFVALDVIGVTALDSGEYTVRATNHLGSAHTSACVRILGRSDVLTETQHEGAWEQIQMLEDASRYGRQVQEDITVEQIPTFTKPLHNIETIEGTNIHMECRLIPVGDPSMRIDWLVNGKPIRTGHRFRPAFDFDYVALDILSVYPEDSGVYTCRAYNKLGEAITSSSVRVIAKSELILESQHPSGLEKIQYLEDGSRYMRKENVEETVSMKPRFLSKLKPQEALREGNNAHFECKLEPVADPNLKVEWFKNGKPVTVGHRFRPIHDFGYVALDIIGLISEDSGVYTCRAVNAVGSDEVNANLSCKSSRQIVKESQGDVKMEKIQQIEDRTNYKISRHEELEESCTQAPVFTSSLKTIEIKEGQRAHFEARLIPVSDSSLKVEWFRNNVPLKSGSRFTETNSFGFVALDIMHAYPEDAGAYTCRASNALGQAMTSSQLVVHSKKAINVETQNQMALSQIQYLEDSSRQQRISVVEESTSQAPVFTTPMRNLTLKENQAAHFEARLIPVGDSRMKVEWFKNGVALQDANRISTLNDFGFVALDMKYVYPEDSGTYSCRATNDLGEAVTSATLIVQSKESLITETQHRTALEKLQYLEDGSRYQRTVEEDCVVTEAPRFVAPLNGPTKLVEGQNTHFECRIEPYPDPTMKVEWFHNGKALQTGHRFRTVYDFGFAALDILSVYPEDSGEYTIKATNKLGVCVSSLKINVSSRSGLILESQHKSALDKIMYLESDSRFKRVEEVDSTVTDKPSFGRPLRNLSLVEGQSAHLEATLVPVNDPTMRVEWYHNGCPVPQGHRFRTTFDFGFVALDVLYCYPEDSGTYMCKAFNASGEAVTTSSVQVTGKAGLCLDTLDQQRLTKITALETPVHHAKDEVDAPLQRPIFTTPLTNLENMKEGDHAHLECRLEPINDPKLKVEWFVNGVAIRTGHRFRATHDFGYVALDVLYTYPEDTGTYICKATNALGEAVNTCTISVASRKSIYLDSQHPEGWEKIRALESHTHVRPEVEEEPSIAPRFITELQGTTQLSEGQVAHLECRVEPTRDPKLRVELFHNDKPLQSASRYHVTSDFGYIALDIKHIYPEDGGKYTVKVSNDLGQCSSSININVEGKGGLILESQHPQGLDKIRQLEDDSRFRKEIHLEPVSFQRPVFTAPLKNIEAVAEGTSSHFECRLIPVGDPSLKVEWFRNEQPLEDSSRIQKVHDFGYVALDISHMRAEDEGIYMCRATNSLGEAVTTASLKVLSKASIQMESQHPEGMKKIQRLEEGKAPQPTSALDNVFDKPVFTAHLTGPAELVEGQNAHFECRVLPVGDSSLRFEWYVNGVEMKMGSRFHVTHDFGYVTLDMNSVIPEDSGVYMCKAINDAGDALSTTAMKVRSRGSILGDAMQPQAWQKIQLKETELNRAPADYQEPDVSELPRFVKQLVNQELLAEGSNLHLEAQVEPRSDPHLKVEWYQNGVQLMTGSRVRSTFDFGLVSLDITSLRAEDSGIYVCKAVNRVGEAVSTCTIRVEAHGWLLGNALHPEALAKIQALEEQQIKEMSEEETNFESPVFITHLNNVECHEGETAHFECRVQPSKDPTMNIEWFVNGKQLPVASRFNSTYDFGYVSLDISHVYAEDSGVYTCKATNNKGSAVSTGTLRCTSKANIYLDTQHPQGKAGLEKVHDAEEAYANKYQRQSSMPDATFPKPLFIIPLEEKFTPNEGKPLHMECHVEPKQDPKLRVEWFLNGKLLDHGSRFRMTNDFGFVSLDLTDVYARDQGIYTCRATNAAGEAFTTTTVYCTGLGGLIEDTQHPKGEAGLEQIQRLEDSLLPGGRGELADEDGKAPVFTSQFQNVTNLLEGDIAHFEATLTPVGDQTMVVEWFYNGQSLKSGHRQRTVHAFGMVVLEIIGTKVEDSGVYTARATNKWGVAEISVTLECVDLSSGQKPEFTSQIQSLEGLKDGASVHFECTLIPVGDPNLKVEWFHNGQPLRHSSRIKTVSDFGFVVLDIAYVQSHDSGEYICKASNKFGEDFTRATLRCVGKSGVYLDSLQPDSLAKIRALEEPSYSAPAPLVPAQEAPKFVTQLSDIARLIEGQSAHFEARLTPVNDPLLTVEWYLNGVKLPTGHRFRTFHDFGIVILDILYCYEEDCGVYECRATNKLGQDVTRATLRCLSKASLILDSQLPKGMESLQKIQNLEDKERREGVVEETKRQAPVFTVPLNDVAGLREGENAHFEGRLTPTDDPKLQVEWFFNGKPLKTGSRIRTFCDFGFVILEISPIYPEDSGEYSCRATNEFGEAVTSASLVCQGKRNVIFESQLPKGMERTIEKIAELEGLGMRPADYGAESDTGKPPEFLSTPGDLLLPENGLAHFECKLIPVGDPSLRVEWFHNGKPLLAGSRVKTISDFGFVILEVSGVYQRDAGLYTCKASNKHGETSVSCTLQVKGRQGIILEPQLPTSFKSGTQSIQKLEENLWKREEQAEAEEEKPNPPRFVSDIKDVDLIEGQAAHFDCRVEPVGDASMRVEWFHNGRPLGSGSRIRMIDDFGFVVLDIDWTFPRDAGEYVCRATNRWGTAKTSAKLVTKAKRDVNMESQLPQGMAGEKLRDLERGPITQRIIQEDAPAQAPHFVTQIAEVAIEEGENAHFECRVEPKSDSNLRVEWYHNGKVLPNGHRFRTMCELGFVSLDILYAYPEDAGEYLCRAWNAIGEDKTKAVLTCKSVPAIIMQNQMPRGMKKSETLLQMEAALKKYTSEIFLTEEDIYDGDKKQPPRFVTHIKDKMDLKEMQASKFECQLAPVGDPNMCVEWFFNGKPLPYKTRFTPIYDFGYVAMNFGWVYPEDSGEYVCRATNLYGSDETRAVIKSTGKPGIIYDSQLPKGMQSVEMIREMEANWQRLPDDSAEVEKEKSAPVFVLKPENTDVMEGEWARFCCRVTGFPRPRVMWILNGHTVINGTRYKLTYDGMWHLDIPKTRQYDEGKLEIMARNSQGQAGCSVELKVLPRSDDHRGVLKNSPKPWYDYDLKNYQQDRHSELQRRFDDRLTTTSVEATDMLRKKSSQEMETEWQKQVKTKKNDEYYKNLKELEDSQVTKEVKLRETSHQFAIPGEKIHMSSLAKGMAQSYETKLDQTETSNNSLTQTITRNVKEEAVSAVATRKGSAHRSEVHIDSEVGGIPPDPYESSVHGREVHVAKQKQTQKEVQGQLEITRKITATETTEVEHKARTQERVVQGPVKPAVPPFFTKKIQPCRVFEHESARFEVEFEGDPNPSITWYREDFAIKNSSEFQIHTFGSKSVLIIRQVFMEDSGIFAAVAENRGGAAKCSANLVVEERRQGRGGLVPPSFLTTIQDAIVKAGQLVRFDAKVTGTKPMDIYWLKNGRKISSDIRYKILEEDEIHTLIIIETLPEDSGVYECVAINSAGEGRCEAECLVEVVASPTAAPTTPDAVKGKLTPPKMVLAIKEQNVPEGQPAVFRCRVSGNPVPQITWEKDGQQIKPSRYFIMSQEGNDIHVLRISEAFPEDEGLYRCVASNSNGQVQCDASLHVIAPGSDDVPPSLTPLDDVSVVEGSPVQFRTLVTGNPMPMVQWMREGQIIPPSSDFQMIQQDNHALLLIKTTYPEDSGVYTCRATNPASQVESSAYLTVHRRKPGSEPWKEKAKVPSQQPSSNKKQTWNYTEDSQITKDRITTETTEKSVKDSKNGTQHVPWRSASSGRSRRESSSPPTERIPLEGLSVEAPWPQRSQSEGRHSRLPPATKKEDEIAWKKHGTQLLKKNKSQNRSEMRDSQLSTEQAVPWKTGAESLKKISKQRTSLIDSMSSTATAEQIPWKTGIQKLRKISREPSPIKSSGELVSRDTSPGKSTVTELEWKSGTQILRQRSLTPDKGKTESTPKELTSTSKPVEDKREVKPGFLPKNRSTRPPDVEEPIPEVILKRTPQKPKPSEPEASQIDLKKIPPKTKTENPAMGIPLKPILPKETSGQEKVQEDTKVQIVSQLIPPRLETEVPMQSTISIEKPKLKVTEKQLKLETEPMLSVLKLEPKVVDETLTRSTTVYDEQIEIKVKPTATSEAPMKPAKIEETNIDDIVNTAKSVQDGIAKTTHKNLKSKKNEKLEVVQPKIESDMEKIYSEQTEKKVILKSDTLDKTITKTAFDKKVLTSIQLASTPDEEKPSHSESVIDGNPKQRKPTLFGSEATATKDIDTEKQLVDVKSTKTIQLNPITATEPVKADLKAEEVVNITPPWRKPKPSISEAVAVTSKGENKEKSIPTELKVEETTLPEESSPQNQTVSEVTLTFKSDTKVKRPKGLKKPERQVPLPTEGQVLTPWGTKLKSSVRKPTHQEKESTDITLEEPTLSETNVVPEVSSIPNQEISQAAFNLKPIDQTSSITFTEIHQEKPSTQSKTKLEIEEQVAVVQLKETPQSKLLEDITPEVILKPVSKKETDSTASEEANKTPWRSLKQSEAIERQPEIQLEKTPLSERPEEVLADQTSLKPISKKKNEDIPLEEIILKPISKKEKQQIVLEETRKTPGHSKKQPEIEELPKVQLKKTPQKKRPEELPVEQVTLKPILKKDKSTEETSLKPISQKEEEQVLVEAVSFKPVSEKEKEQVVPEETSKTPWRSKKQSKAVEQMPEIQLKKVPKSKRPEEIPEEKVTLKPIPNKGKKDTLTEEASLQPIPLIKKEQVVLEETSKVLPRSKDEPVTQARLPEVQLQISQSKLHEEFSIELVSLESTPQEIVMEEIGLKPISKQEKELVSEETSKTPWRSKKELEVGEKLPEVLLKKTPQSKRSEELRSEEVNLKPTSKNGKKDIPMEETSLKPISKKEKEQVVPEETTMTPARSKKRPETEEQLPKVQLKKTPQTIHPKEDTEQIHLKPIPKKEKEDIPTEEGSLKPIPKREKEQVAQEETTTIPTLSKKQPKTEELPKVQSKKVLQSKGPEELSVEQVSLKPIPKKEKEEIIGEEIRLKSIPKKEEENVVPDETSKAPWRSKKLPKVEEQLPEVQLKKTPQSKRPEEPSSEQVELKPIPKKEKEDTPVEVINRQPTSEKEKEQVVPEDTSRTSTRSKKQPKAEEHLPEVQLKKTPQTKRSVEIHAEQVDLKPIPKKDKEDVPTGQTALKPFSKKTKEPAVPEKSDVQQISKIEKEPIISEETCKISSRPKKQPSAEEEIPVVQLKKTPQSEHPEEILVEGIQLKPVPIKEKEQDVSEGIRKHPSRSKKQPVTTEKLPMVQLKKIPQSKGSEETEQKRIPKRQKDEILVEEASLKPISVKEEEVAVTEESKKTPSRPKKQPVPEKQLSAIESKKIPESKRSEEVPVDNVSLKPIQKVQPDDIKQQKDVQLKQSSKSKAEQISEAEIKLKTVSKKTTLSTKGKNSVEEPLDVLQTCMKSEQEQSPSPSISVTSIELKPQLNKVAVVGIVPKKISVPDSSTEPENITMEIQMSSTRKPDEKKESHSFNRVERILKSTDSEEEQSTRSMTRVDTIVSEMKTSTLEKVISTTAQIPDRQEQPESQLSESTEVTQVKPKVLKKAMLGTIPRYIAPSFKKKLQPLTSRPGKKIRLNCLFEGEPVPSITWYSNEIVIKPCEHWAITTQGDSSVLEISNVTPEDSGIYTCRAVNEAGSATTSANVIVTVKDDKGEAPRFVWPLTPMRVSDGEPTKLICTLTGKPIPAITWYQHGRELIPSKDFQPHFEGSTGTASLHITEVFPDDAGIYRCRAANKHGMAECEATLSVGDEIVASRVDMHKAPFIILPLEPDEVERNGRKVMTVRFDGHPLPEIKWYHNNREIQQTNNTLINNYKNESTLVIVQCTPNEVGKYEARAMNESGEARSSATLRLKEINNRVDDTRPPKFVTALRPQFVPEGEATILNVEVDSVPESVFTWKQHGVLIQSSPIMDISSQRNCSTLLIPESSVENSGIFTVKAENSAGSVTSTVTLTVEKPLQEEDFTPPVVIEALPSATTVMDGEEVKLSCQIQGTPMPRVKWFHNGKPVREHQAVTMSLSPEGEVALHFVEVFPEDAGVYECMAVNPAGQIATSVCLNVESYEYIPDSESASITAGPSGVWEEATGPSGSEEDLLSDKPSVREVKMKTKKKNKSSRFQPQESRDDDLMKDSGSAPRFVTILSPTTDISDGNQARFEVKVEAYPRSVVRWYLNGKEILPSKDFVIDNLEDGTSILSIGEMFPDDIGELMCEAQNDNGIATTTTQLNMIGYKDTPLYRKPEWVTRMEVARAHMLGNPVTLPRVRMTECSESDRSMSIDSAHVHEFLSKYHSLGDISTGSDSVFISECSSRRPSLRANEFESPHLQTFPSELSTASIFAQSVLSGYLESHRQSISAAIEAIGCPMETDDLSDKTPTPSDNESNDTSPEEEPDCIPEELVQRLDSARHLNFSTMLSPIQENGETPTSDSATMEQSISKQHMEHFKNSTTDLMSASSMEDLKEFLMLETLYTSCQ